MPFVSRVADHSQLGDSLDWLMDDNARQYSDTSESVEDAVLRKMAEDELHLALGKLTDEEYALVHVLFFEGKTERAYAKALGASQVAVHNCADGICTICNKKEETVQAPRRYIISKSCSYVPVRVDYSQVLPGALPSVQPD